MYGTGHKTTKECASKPAVKAEWSERTSGRRWREVECKGCGLRTRQVHVGDSFQDEHGEVVKSTRWLSWWKVAA